MYCAILHRMSTILTTPLIILYVVSKRPPNILMHILKGKIMERKKVKNMFELLHLTKKLLWVKKT